MRSAIALLVALVPGLALACSATLSWTQSAQNTDGTAVSITGNRVLWGSQPGNYPNAKLLSAVTGYTVDMLPDGGQAYFVVTALSSQGESALSNAATKPCPAVPVFAPNVPTNFSMTFKPTPVVPAMSVSLTLVPADPRAVDEYFLTIAGAAPVTFTLLAGTTVDWIEQGGQPGGGGGTLVLPALGGNNDGKNATTFMVPGPINGARVDFDGAAFAGASVTVAGVTKPMTKSGSAWQAVFP